MTPPVDFRALYEAHVGHVWRTLRRLGVASRDLEDATHEVFLVAHRRLGDFDPTRPARAWLTGIAWRVASDERRRARHHREQLGGEEVLISQPDPGRSPEAVVQSHEARALVAQGLDALEPPQRVVFVMYEIDGATGREIAEAVGIPLYTVYSRLRAARARFKAAVTAATAPTPTEDRR